MTRHLRLTPRSTAIAVAACSLLLAACGSSSDSTNTAASGRINAQGQQQMVLFTNCMRNNGVPSFQDPAVGANKAELAPGSPHSPAFLTAYSVCQHLLPGGGPGDGTPHSPAQIAAALAFARCVRSHGFPSFPDPTNAGRLTHEMVAAAGINLHQPAVLQAGDACAGLTHGFITRAIVARFVAGQ
jgi:hypothetical protein